MRRIITGGVFLFVFFFVAAATVEACSCMATGAPCQSFWTTEAVFSGQVTEIKESSQQVITEDTKRSFAFPKKTIRFAVGEAFRGANEKILEVETGMGGGDCGFAFETGQSYLVYAYRNRETGKLGTGICTRTQLLAKASEDLEYIRGLKDAPSGGAISGKVVKYLVRKSDDEYKPNPPLENVQITFVGKDNTYEATTDGRGEYRLTGVAAGEYKMRVGVPVGMWGFEKEQTVKLSDKGCVALYTALSVKTFIGGKIKTEDGAILKDIGVNLIPVDQINARYQKDSRYASADEDGNYLFKDVPAGTYYLGVRLSRISETNFPYPRTFYPGTTNLETAAQITISEGQTFENFDFTLAKKLAPRKVSGIVVMPDGKPAKASVCVEEVEYAEGSMCQNGIETDAQGKFSFVLPDNMRFLIRSHAQFQNNQRHAEPVEVSKNGDVSNIKLVISEPNGSCEKCRVWKRNKN